LKRWKLAQFNSETGKGIAMNDRRRHFNEACEGHDAACPDRNPSGGADATFLLQTFLAPRRHAGRDME
jgi:hypothetical protein